MQIEFISWHMGVHVSVGHVSIPSWLCQRIKTSLNVCKHSNKHAMHTSKPTDCCCAIQANCDIDSSIPLLAETGPLAIPLQCLIKQALVSVQPQVRL